MTAANITQYNTAFFLNIPEEILKGSIENLKNDIENIIIYSIYPHDEVVFNNLPLTLKFIYVFNSHGDDEEVRAMFVKMPYDCQLIFCKNYKLISYKYICLHIPKWCFNAVDGVKSYKNIDDKIISLTEPTIKGYEKEHFKNDILIKISININQYI